VLKQSGKKREEVVIKSKRAPGKLCLFVYNVIDRAISADAAFAAGSVPRPLTTQARSFNARSICVS
jgi:hypothetical protein